MSGNKLTLAHRLCSIEKGEEEEGRGGEEE